MCNGICRSWMSGLLERITAAYGSVDGSRFKKEILTTHPSARVSRREERREIRVLPFEFSEKRLTVITSTSPAITASDLNKKHPRNGVAPRSETFIVRSKARSGAECRVVGLRYSATLRS